ncbi:MAG TPA: MBL fold metallo-hydrolase, partial [Candidatus Binataceae bacterium]|nr:MBL fold metallo-hydrolase [Candidatus Binataceae bacterium]
MASGNGSLKEVDRVEITTVLDNFIDVLLPGSETVKRVSLGANWVTKKTLIAEHGFAAIVKVSAGNSGDSILFDAGLSKNGLTHNLDVLDGRPKEFHAIVLSHGHADHTRGLMGLVERLSPRKMPLLLHPDALLERKVIF